MEALKQKLKGLIPKSVMYRYYLHSAQKAVLPDLKRRVYDKVYNDSEVDRLKRDLTLQYHIVEKGLTMPEPRPGFGRLVVLKLCDLVIKYDKMQLPTDALEFSQSVSVLKEYYHFHESIAFELDAEVRAKLVPIVEGFKNVVGLSQISTSNAEYFRHINAPFDVFSHSRYSVRNYSKIEVPVELLLECVDLAQKSPSFCNRQPTRVHIVKSAEKKQAILDIQNGNRGFGHLAETLIVLTSVISTTKDIHERNENHLNGGMFAMSLLLAMHFKKIAACALNWAVSEDKEIVMRRILKLDSNEIPLLVISCGFPPETFNVAASPRKKANEITVSHL